MCGRYALALRPSQIRRMLQDNDMPVWEAPEDEGDGAPRQSYNFAPGYHGLVYRADVPDYGAGPHRDHRSGGEHNENEDNSPPDTSSSREQQEETHYKLQSMKWGLIPFWTKRSPDYANMLKTINCRDDSLAASGGMWSSMKGRKRCIVIAQGFFEWLKTGPKERMPHYIKRKDGNLMCLAGLWDCVQYEDDDDAATAKQKNKKNFTYTIITTDSNKQLKFLHDRMPVILDPGSTALTTWLDAQRHEWNKELQDILKPFSGELEVYAVSKEMNKVGNSSPNFIIPVASKENKGNIANFFANAKQSDKGKTTPAVEVKKELPETKTTMPSQAELKTVDEVAETADDGGMGVSGRLKREADGDAKEPLAKKTKMSPSPSPAKPTRSKISAVDNGTKSPVKKSNSSQKITKFFGNSA